MRATRTNPILIALCALTITAAFAWRAGATAQRPPAQPVAVATVDIVEIINGLEEREVLENDLTRRLETRQAQVDEVVEELKVLDADIKELVPGTDAQRDKIREAMEKRAVVEARRKALSQIVSIDMGTVMAGLYGKVENAIERIAEREGLDIVLMDDSRFPLPENAPDSEVYRAIITKGVFYRHDSIDITNQVITLMNNEFSAP